jgi:hypothetical protein
VVSNSAVAGGDIWPAFSESVENAGGAASRATGPRLDGRPEQRTGNLTDRRLLEDD